MINILSAVIQSKHSSLSLNIPIIRPYSETFNAIQVFVFL